MIRPRFQKLLLSGLLLALFIVLAFFAADFVENSARARELVEQFGYFGIVMLAIVAGVNVIVPVPAATFTPVFLAGGLDIALIIAALVIGTTIADLIGYIIGVYGRNFSKEHYPELYEKLRVANEKHHRWVLPGVFLYAAFVPFPNEAMLIPLALLGFRFQNFALPLILGTTVNQTILAIGFSSVFDALF